MTPEQAQLALAPFRLGSVWINPNINVAMCRCPVCPELFLEVSDETALPPAAKIANVRAKELTVTAQLITHLQAEHTGLLLVRIVCPINDGLTFETDEFKLTTVTEGEETIGQKLEVVHGIDFIVKKDTKGENWEIPKPRLLVPLLIAHLATHQANKW
jgi:hypothetical protein